MQIQPYLFFDGRCEEALNFYHDALGIETTMLMRFKDMPPPSEPRGGGQNPVIPPGTENKVMHASFRIGETVVNASDGHCQGKAAFEGFGLALNVADEKEAERVFATLGQGGEVRMPLGKTFFSPSFGMTTDRFGVLWMVIVER